MNSLLKHNLIAGWRNIMKYKVQNTVSVLCLAVGAVLFGITLYFSNIIWGNKITTSEDNNHVRFLMADGSDNNNNIGADSITMNSLCNLPSVKSVCYSQSTTYSVFLSNKWFDLGEQAEYITPDFLVTNDFRSSITRKKIGTLKPGTIIATQQWYNVNVGTAPIGSKIRFNGNKVGNVSDVVYSTTYIGNFSSVYIVVPESNVQKPSYAHSNPIPISVTLKEGYTAEQFKAQFEESVHNLKIKIPSNAFNWNVFLLYIAIILTGSIVLVIGMSGYLKMQLQLFCLRSKEMALRRCNGAKPAQLFTLLCSEMLIIFLFTAIVAIIISIAFVSYAMPKLSALDLDLLSQFYIDLRTIYSIVGWVVAVTFLIAVGIAWITVRKTLKNSLNTTISSTFSQRSVWNKSMQIMQYFATAILLMVFGCFFFVIGQESHFFNLAKDINEFKKTGIQYGYDDQLSITKSPLVEKYGWLYLIPFDISQKDSVRLDIKINNEPRPTTDSITCYNAFVGNAETFKLLKKRIQKDEQRNQIPVYVKVDDASSITKQLDLTYKPDNKIYTLPNNKKYILLGWASEGIPTELNVGFYVIENNLYDYSPEADDVEKCLFLKVKNDDYDALNNQAEKYYVTSLYDSNWCAELRKFTFISTLLFILAIVSVISIVMTIYSSISLETRGKQKEVAIRKVNGAKTKDIIILFCRYYIDTLGITFGIIFVLSLTLAIFFLNNGQDILGTIFWSVLPGVISIATIATVTILTLWQKIYKIAHINPALLIKKE